MTDQPKNKITITITYFDGNAADIEAAVEATAETIRGRYGVDDVTTKKTRRRG